MLRDLQIMLVEDEPLIAMLIEDNISQESGQSRHFSNVADALAALNSGFLPHVAILDFNLAGEASTPVAERLVSMGIPFVMTTGYDSETLPEVCRSAPVYRKPYDAEDVLRHIAQFRPMLAA